MCIAASSCIASWHFAATLLTCCSLLDDRLALVGVAAALIMANDDSKGGRVNSSSDWAGVTTDGSGRTRHRHYGDGDDGMWPKMNTGGERGERREETASSLHS